MNYINVSHPLALNSDPKFWKKMIRDRLPQLYPIYCRAILDVPPCRAHYEQLLEAVQCINNKINNRPLTPSFKAWIQLETISAIVDQQGREIIYYSGEMLETLAVRLALRNQGRGYMPVSPAPLAAAAGVSVNDLLHDLSHFSAGLLTGLTHKGRTIYLFGERHDRAVFNRVQDILLSLAMKGKVAFF